MRRGTVERDAHDHVRSLSPHCSAGSPCAMTPMGGRGVRAGLWVHPSPLRGEVLCRPPRVLPHTMAGPTSICASVRKGGRCTTGYGRHSPVAKPSSDRGNDAIRVSRPWHAGHGPPWGLLLHHRIPALGHCLLWGRFVGEEKPCTGLDLLIHGHVQGMDRFRPSADVLIARCVVVEIGEFYRYVICEIWEIAV